MEHQCGFDLSREVSITFLQSPLSHIYLREGRVGRPSPGGVVVAYAIQRQVDRQTCPSCNEHHRMDLDFVPEVFIGRYWYSKPGDPYWDSPGTAVESLSICPGRTSHGVGGRTEIPSFVERNRRINVVAHNKWWAEIDRVRLGPPPPADVEGFLRSNLWRLGEHHKWEDPRHRNDRDLAQSLSKTSAEAVEEQMERDAQVLLLEKGWRIDSPVKLWRDPISGGTTNRWRTALRTQLERDIRLPAFDLRY